MIDLRGAIVFLWAAIAAVAMLAAAFATLIAAIFVPFMPAFVAPSIIAGAGVVGFIGAALKFPMDG